MKILINCPLSLSKKNKFNNKSGGIESLNMGLAQLLHKKKN